MSERRNKRAYLDDYEDVGDGTYRYTGVTWHWESGDARRAFLGLAWALLAGAACCALAAGFVPRAGVGNTFFVLLPYSGTLVGVALSVVALWHVSREGEMVRDHIRTTYVEGLNPRLLLGIVCGFICGVGNALCLMLGWGGIESAALALAYSLLMVASAALQLLLMRRLKTIPLSV